MRPKEATTVDQRVFSTSGIARELGVSNSLIDKLERLQLIPRAPRLEGSGRRLFTDRDVEAIRAVVEERRKARGAATVAA